MGMPTTADKFIKNNHFRLILPKDIKVWPCLPTPQATNHITEIETNSLLVCQGTLQILTETVVVFQKKDYEDYGTSREFYLSLEVAKNYCLYVRKHNQPKT